MSLIFDFESLMVKNRPEKCEKVIMITAIKVSSPVLILMSKNCKKSFTKKPTNELLQANICKKTENIFDFIEKNLISTILLC